jgi:hypothetical protein
MVAVPADGKTDMVRLAADGHAAHQSLQTGQQFVRQLNVNPGHPGSLFRRHRSLRKQYTRQSLYFSIFLFDSRLWKPIVVMSRDGCHKRETTMNLTKEINVNRTNYDRFVSESGMVYTGQMLDEMRRHGTTIVITDKTLADQGRWILEPLNSRWS